MEPAERPYGLDDLVAHEKRQMRLVLVVLVVAVVGYGLRGRLGGARGDGAAAAPGSAAVGSR